MGTWVHLGVWPDEGNELTQPQFAQLVSDLITERLLAMPCALLEGIINISETPLHFHDMLTGTAPLPDTIKIRYQGDSLPELLRAISAAPFGASNLCVVFDGFDWTNTTLSESFQKQNWANAYTALYALQAPQEITFHEELTPFEEGTGEDEEFEDDPDEDEETIDVRTYMVRQGFFSYGKSGPEGIKDTPLDPVFRRSFGAEIWLDYDYS
jgi:hypothetical protein